MPEYYSFFVPFGLALFAAIVGFIWLEMERRQDLREKKQAGQTEHKSASA